MPRRARAEEIAAHACQRYSGRVGRSAAAKEFDPEAVRLAVLAHIRHAHSNYDSLLGQMMDRFEARQAVRNQVEAMRERWEKAK